MKVLGDEKLTPFAMEHPDAESSLRRWLSITETAEWNNFVELRQSFQTADYYKKAVIFNIAGNKYRLIAHVMYRRKIVSVFRILTHAEYDQRGWKNEYERYGKEAE